MIDAKPVAELRREAHAEIEKWLRQAKIFSTNPACDNSILKLSVAAASSIDAIADLAEAAESDLQRTTQLWKRALADLKAAESRIANEIAARQRAQKHGIGDRARIEELERERDEARRHAHRWWGTGDTCQCCGEKYPLSMKVPK